MQIGGKEYRVGQRIRVINAKSVLHYRYGIIGDCNKDMTGINGTLRAAGGVLRRRVGNSDNREHQDKGKYP